MKICDLKVGQKVTIDLVVAGASIRQTKGKPPRDFLSVDLSDGNDTLDGKIWNYDASNGVPENGKVYTATGVIGEYQGKKQITLEGFWLSLDQDVRRFLPQFVEDIDKVYNNMLMAIGGIKHENMRKLCEHIYKKHIMDIKRASSACGVHHVGMGGNLAHTCEVTCFAEQIAYAASVLGYEVNTDLCIAGAALHDIGKIFTYDYDGAAVCMTPAGMMLEHHIIGIEMVDAAINELFPDQMNEKWVRAVKHIIASHHGELEFGSPVVPLFNEAYIVNAADKLSSEMAMVKQANDKAIQEGKDMTDRIFQLHNRPHFLQKELI